MYFLSTQSLADLIGGYPSPLTSWAATLRQSGEFFCTSVISFGQIGLAIEILSPDKRGRWRSRLDKAEQEFDRMGIVLPVDMATVGVWRDIGLLELSGLRNKNSVTLGADDQLVVSTAISRRATFVDAPQPYHEILGQTQKLSVFYPETT